MLSFLLKFTIPKELIGAVIGPGGKIIQGIQADTNTVISIDEDDDHGIVEIASNNKENLDAAYAKMEAEARGLYEILSRQAAGYDKMVEAAGGDANKAYMLLLLEKLPELVKTQVEAVKGINIDHVTVWDSGNGADGKGSTANFLSGLMKSVPPLNELFDQAGLALPEYLAKKNEKKEEEPAKDFDEVSE